MLLDLLKVSKPRVISVSDGGIPADAKVLRMGYDPVKDDVLAYYEHPDFPLSVEGQTVEELHPIFEEKHGDEAVKALKG